MKATMKALYARLLKIQGKSDEEIARALRVESWQVTELLHSSRAAPAPVQEAKSNPDDDQQSKAA